MYKSCFAFIPVERFRGFISIAGDPIKTEKKAGKGFKSDNGFTQIQNGFYRHLLIEDIYELNIK